MLIVFEINEYRYKIIPKTLFNNNFILKYFFNKVLES